MVGGWCIKSKLGVGKVPWFLLVFVVSLRKQLMSCSEQRENSHPVPPALSPKSVCLFLTGVVRQQPGPSFQTKANIWEDVLTATKTHEVRFLVFVVVALFCFVLLFS